MNHAEDALQIAVAEFLRVALRDDECLFYSVPNGGKRSKIEAARLKKMGLRAGVPDLAFVLPGGRAGFIELKAGKGRLSKAQDETADFVTGIGARWGVARSVEGVEWVLREWRVPLHASVLPRSEIARAAE